MKSAKIIDCAIRARAARTEPSDTYLVSSTAIKNTRTHIRMVLGKATIISPSAVAIPFPPMNLR